MASKTSVCDSSRESKEGTAKLSNFKGWTFAYKFGFVQMYGAKLVQKRNSTDKSRGPSSTVKN